MITITFPEWVVWGVGIVFILNIIVLMMKVWATKVMADSFDRKLSTLTSAELATILNKKGR